MAQPTKHTTLNEHWLENLDKIKDSARENYFSSLPDEEKLKQFFSDAFIINSPLGKVGGDGFWLHTQGGDLYLAMFTCVGGGHLANMMIRIYIRALKKMIEGHNIDFPGSMLQFLHREVTNKFKDKNNTLLNTKANVGILKVNLESKQMEYAGANIDLIQVEASGRLKIIRGEKNQIGDIKEATKTFPSILIESSKTSRFYLCSTGVFNLIGGSKFKKLMAADLGVFLREKKRSSLLEQKFLLNDFFKNWTGTRGQNEDVMVLGFKP